MRISDSYMCQHTDLFSQDAAWSSVQGSWTGVEKVVEPIQSLCKGGNMDVTGDRSCINVDYSKTDWRGTSGNNRQTGGFKYRKREKFLTSALSISATIFIALLAPLLHTNFMGLVSACHTSEATIQSSSSPGQTHKHTLKLRRHKPACFSLLTSVFKSS